MGTKVFDTPAAAVADVSDGASIAVGGFGLCGIPDALIRALVTSGVDDLEAFSNNCDVDDHGLDDVVAATATPLEIRTAEFV